MLVNNLSMALQFLPSQKGKGQLVRNGHLFNFSQNLANDDKSWICTKYYTLRCSARIRTNAGKTEIIEETIVHNHAPDPAKIAAKTVVQQLRQRAVETQEAPQQLIANVTVGKYLF